MYKAVIFDLDGTLLNTLPDLANAGNHTLQAMGLPTHPEFAYGTMVGHGIPVLVKNMLPANQRGKSTQEVALTLFERYYSAHMADLTAPYSGILGLLSALKQAGVKTAVLSNKAHPLTLAVIHEYFADCFDYVQGFGEDYPPKPDAASAKFLVEHLGEGFASTLYCGDTDVDMQTAKNAGLTACGVLWGFREREELSANGADILVKTPAELQELILGQ